jgi:hypothetical protein
MSPGTDIEARLPPLLNRNQRLRRVSCRADAGAEAMCSMTVV